MESKEELLAMATHRRDALIADTVTLVLGVAAEKHPEELRRALSSVFSLSAVEDYMKQVNLVVSATREQAREAQILLENIQKDIDRMEQRLDGLNAALEYKASIRPLPPHPAKRA